MYKSVKISLITASVLATIFSGCSSSHTRSGKLEDYQLTQESDFEKPKEVEASYKYDFSDFEAKFKTLTNALSKKETVLIDDNLKLTLEGIKKDPSESLINYGQSTVQSDYIHKCDNLLSHTKIKKLTYENRVDLENTLSSVLYAEKRLLQADANAFSKEFKFHDLDIRDVYKPCQKKAKALQTLLTYFKSDDFKLKDSIESSCRYLDLPAKTLYEAKKAKRYLNSMVDDSISLIAKTPDTFSFNHIYDKKIKACFQEKLSNNEAINLLSYAEQIKQLDFMEAFEKLSTYRDSTKFSFRGTTSKFITKEVGSLEEGYERDDKDLRMLMDIQRKNQTELIEFIKGYDKGLTPLSAQMVNDYFENNLKAMQKVKNYEENVRNTAIANLELADDYGYDDSMKGIQNLLNDIQQERLTIDDAKEMIIVPNKDDEIFRFQVTHDDYDVFRGNRFHYIALEEGEREGLVANGTSFIEKNYYYNLTDISKVTTLAGKTFPLYVFERIEKDD